VLIVDDAVVVHKALTDALARDPALEVVGTASNGRLALTKFTQLRPDIVLLDIEARDERARNRSGDPQARPPRAHHHVQHAHGTRRGSHAGGTLTGCDRLRHQAKQHGYPPFTAYPTSLFPRSKPSAMGRQPQFRRLLPP